MRGDKMNYTIKNQDLLLEISNHGAEIKVIKYQNIDYLHNSDPKFWGRSAPILFPNIGTIKNGQSFINNIPYTMMKHGFIRDRDFTITHHETSSITFSYLSTEEDLKLYPFSFNIDVTYQVHGNLLKSYIVITNLSDETMPFNLGLHPAFKVPLFDGEKFEDYKIIFKDAGDYDCPSVELENGTINFNKIAKTFTNLKVLPLNYEDYQNDALIFTNLKTHFLKLVNKDENHGIAFEFNDFPMLGIWTPNHIKANFLCIEPWIGCADPSNHNGNFNDKLHLIHLDKKETQLITYQIKFF